VEKNFIRRVCDHCGTRQDFDQQKMTPGEEKDVQHWITMARVYIVHGQPYPVLKHACKDSCGKNLIETRALDLPQEIQEMLEQEEEQKQLALNSAKPGFAGVSARSAETAKC
jgi:hypothetical protein